MDSCNITVFLRRSFKTGEEQISVIMKRPSGKPTMRILVVEDEEKVASFIKKGLEQSAYTVDLADNGEDGLEMARSNEYDAIVLDIMLPGMDGLQIVRELRSRGS